MFRFSAIRLSFDDFISLTKINRWTEINNTLIAKGFKFAGNQKGSHNNSAFWTKNCSIQFDNEGRMIFDADFKKKMFELIEIYDGEFRMLSYYFQSKDAYDTFIMAAQQDGFEFVRDGISDNRINALYMKHYYISDNEYYDHFIIYINENELCEVNFRNKLTGDEMRKIMNDFEDKKEKEKQQEEAEAEKKEQEDAAKIKPSPKPAPPPAKKKENTSKYR